MGTTAGDPWQGFSPPRPVKNLTEFMEGMEFLELLHKVL